MNKAPLILAIETAVREGSISLLRGNQELGHKIGDGNFARSQDLLQMIADVLNEHDIDSKGLDLIAVSNGPGSTTGIRIGIATAKALAHGLNCEYTEVSVLEALTKASDNQEVSVISIASAGRMQFSWQIYDKEKNLVSKEQEGTLELFINQLKALRLEGFIVVAESKLAQELKTLFEMKGINQEIISASDNIACLVGWCALNNINLNN